MIETTPLVSIIITTYNRADVLGEAIDSALAQSYPNLEVIVVDDGSSDGTQELLRSYGERIVSIRRSNGGYGAARNTGLRAARGKYIAWLDSDDIFLPDKIAVQAAFCEAHDDVVLVSTDFAGFDARGPRPSSVRTYYSAFERVPGGAEAIYPITEFVERPGTAPVPVRSGHVVQHLLNGSFVHPPTVLMRREAVLEAGELDATLRNSIEYPFFFRLARLGRFAFVDAPLLRYRYSADQLSGESHSLGMSLSILRILQELPRREPDVVRAAPRLYRRRLGTAHLIAAGALAVSDRPRAFRESWQAVRRGVLSTMLMKTWLRLLLPSMAVNGLLHVKRLVGTWRAAAVMFLTDALPELSELLVVLA